MLKELSTRLELRKEATSEQSARLVLLDRARFRSVTIADLDFNHHTQGIFATSSLLGQAEDGGACRRGVCGG